MRLGALLGPISGQEPRALAEQARACSGAGFESLWTAHAVGRGFMVTDPIVALTVAASVTDTVEIGSAVVQLPLYHPVDLACRVLSLAQICGDRLRLGVGCGSTRQDFEAFSRSYHTRFSDFDRRLEDLRALLANGRLGDVDLTPWPGLSGGLPVLYGTWGKGVARAATEFDGWIASAMHRTPDEVIAALERYRGAGGGRAIVSTIQLPAGTDLAELEAKLNRFAEAGFDDAVVMFLPGGPEPAEVRALIR